MPSDLKQPEPLPSFLSTQGKDCVVSVKLQPRASSNGICGILGDALKIKVTAPPVDSAANKLLIAYLAEILDISKGSVQIVRGQTSRNKTVRIADITPQTFLSKTKQYL